MSPFCKALNLASTKILADINQQCYKIAWELFTSIVKLSPSPANNSPYAIGMLANQWYPTAGVPSNAQGADVSPNGAASLSRINAMMGGTEFYEHDGRMFLTNNVGHAYRAEVLGWPKDAARGWTGTIGPYRMVARSLQATAAKYQKGKI